MASLEAAALAGAAAAVLLALSAFLLRRQPGVGSSSADLKWYSDSGNRLTVMFGLTVAPLGVVALLWFMAVIRRRLGDREDRFFATVFLGSGVAFAVLTMAAAVAAALPTLVVWSGDSAQPDRATLELARALWFVNDGRKLTPWRRMKTDPLDGHCSSVAAVGTRPRSRSLSR
jgi:hypothetical protein